jgi:hypothetical protein
MPGQWQYSVNQDQRVGLSDTETFQINLSKANFTSEVDLKIAVTNGATSNSPTTSIPATVVDGTLRIEILANGGDVKNYRGYECIKWAQFLRGAKPGQNQTMAGAAVQQQFFPIYFGRHFGDELCMLPSKLYKTLVLKVQTTYPISATAGFVTLSEREDVYELEYISDDDPSSKIILRELEVIQYTSSATSGESRVPQGGLPLGNLITKVLLHEYTAGVDDGTDYPYVRLGINNFSEIPIGLTRWQNMQDKNKLDYGLPEDNLSLNVYAATAKVLNTRMSRITSFAVGPSTVATTPAGTVSGDQLTTALGSTSANYFRFQSMAGVAYCILLDVDPLSNFAGGIKSSNVNSVDLAVTAGATNTSSSLLVVSMQEAIIIPVQSTT